MNNHNGGYLETMDYCSQYTVQLVQSCTNTSLLRDVSHPSTTADAVFSTNEQVVVHLTDTAVQTEDEGMTQKKSTIVSNGQSNSSSIQP